MTIIFDYNRTLFDPESDSLYEGVIELLADLSRRHTLVLISRAEAGREMRFESLGIAQFFSKVAFVDEKTGALFLELVGNEDRVFVVGDRVKEEIKIGNSLGFVTIWVRQGRFAGEVPGMPQEEPRYTVTDIRDVASLLKQHDF